MAIGILVIFALLLLSVVYIAVVKSRSAEIVYLVVSWWPPALLLLMHIYRDFFAKTFAYGIGVIMLLVTAFSLVLGMLGVVLVTLISGWDKLRLAVSIFTAIAFVPFLIYLSPLLF
jgi:hypothetical protein